MTRVGVLAPMPSELKPLRKKVPLRREADDSPFHIGEVGGHDVVVSTTGIGTEKATAATERMLDRGDVERLVVCGIAGGMPDGLAIGAIVIPEVVLDGDTGREYVPTTLPGISPHGRLRTSDNVELDAAMLAKLAADGVIALDMETSAVAAVCEARGVPWSVVRSISDVAGDSPLDDEMLAMMDEEGSPKAGAAAAYILKHPTRLPKLMELARGATAAANAAAETTIEVIGRG